MTNHAQVIPDSLLGGLSQIDPNDLQYATRVVDALLDAAGQAGASDVHLQPSDEGLELRFRIDGVLLRAAVLPKAATVNVIARLKVQAGLLTYHTDRPQEGRIRIPGRSLEMRVSTFPTLYGERAVVRLLGSAAQYQRLNDLGLHDDLLGPVRRLLGETSGAIVVCGPAGSGKTTTLYACLREIASQTAGTRSIMSIEDPIEVAVRGVAQSQVNQQAGLDLGTGLRYLMRQDPEVIMVGEIRDRSTAEAALQASLTGHLLLSTFHAGSTAETIGRLLDMGVEPYVLRSGLLAVICQRLLRRLCGCARQAAVDEAGLGLPVQRCLVPVGCQACRGTGYRGRFLLAEILLLKGAGSDREAARADLGRAILARADTSVLEQWAVQGGMITRWQRAAQAVDAGLTSPEEVRRVLGFATPADKC